MDDVKMRDLKNALATVQAEVRAGQARLFTKQLLREIGERGMKRLKQHQGC